MNLRPPLMLALPLLLGALPVPAAPAAWTSRLEPLREAALDRAEEIGASEKPRTREKRALLSALRRLDRSREGLADDLRDLAPVCRVIDRAFPGDPGLDPVLAEAVATLGEAALYERAALLAWLGRLDSDRAEARLVRGVLRMDGLFQRADAAEDRFRRTKYLHRAVKSIASTRKSLDIVSPRIDDPPFTGVAPDFSLEDVNPASATAGLQVSPRDHLGGVTAWYFLEST